jgi:predicted dehydrogenase
VETKINVGLIGCGNISGIYLKNCKAFEILNMVACADLDLARAEAKADEHGVPRACTTEALLADPEIQLVINLTVPSVHAAISRAAIRAGKHVYSEKPLATTREVGQQILAEARARGVRVGCAPDTFLGGGLQTCRKLIDDGAIGEPVAATAFMTSHGPETWHPDPEFFYQPGGGPMFDMGPYYLTALVHLLGPIARVTGSARISFPERIITSQPHHGTVIHVQTPTHVAGVLDFVSGLVATIITSFDIWAASLPRLEIYGAEGSLNVPDPNTFGGPVRIRRADEKEWIELPVTHGFTANSRGLGVADMAQAILTDSPHRASGEMAYHVLDAMQAFEEASRAGCHLGLASRCERPAPLPKGGL